MPLYRKYFDNRKGRPIDTRLIREFEDTLNANKLVSGHNTRIRRTPNGTIVEAVARRARGGGTPGPTLWDFINMEFVGNTFEIVHGAVGGIIASNLGSTLTFDPVGRTYVAASCTTSNGSLQSFAYATSGTFTPISSALNAPPTSFSFLIGFLDSGVPTKLVNALPLTVAPYELYRVSKAVNPLLGLPYESYYSWRILQ